MSENTLRQADNELVIEGVLQEVRLETKKSGEGKEFIGGEIDIATSETEIHTFRVFSMKLKKDGSENGIYKGLETVMNEYESVAKVGKEAAHKVRVTAGQLGVNDYVGGDGQVKSFPQLSTNFINRVQANEEFEPKAEFEVELFVQSVIEETNRDGDDTGRVKVKGYVPQYGGQIAPLEFVVTEEGSEYVRDTYEPGQTVKIYGDIVNKVETVKTLEDVGFGKPKEKVKRNYVREFVITGGSEPYDEENAKAYKLETIKKALTEREVYLEGLKAKKNQPKKEEKKTGFDTKSAKKDKPKVNIDLPF